MDVIPAIDLINGKCVRLFQGDYSKKTVYSDDPVAVARRWQEAGASRLHIVDLDGAEKGNPQNLPVIERILKETGLRVELGGGIRTEATIAGLLDLGIERVILGTIALEQPELTERICHRFGNAIVIGIDARDGYVATHGWKKESSVKAVDMAKDLAARGMKRMLYTDIKRDGTLTEPGYDAISLLVQSLDIPVIAAGGISALEHLRRLAELGVEGAVVGKALYTGDVNLKEAIEALK